MSRSRLQTRLQRLERHASMQKAGILYVWRLPEDSEAEALARCAVNPADFPQVRVHVWFGGQADARLARPPNPCWISQTPPPAALVVQQLHAALRCAYDAGEEGP
jgi:hypothetical protein